MQISQTAQGTGRQSQIPAGNTNIDSSPELQQLLADTPALWRGHTPGNKVLIHPRAREKHLPRHDLFDDSVPDTQSATVQSTGFAELDQLLPGGGWPVSGLIEVVSRHKAIGELQMLMPLLRLRSQQKNQSLLWITPPYALHGPALAQSGVNIRNSFVVPAQTRCNNALWSIEKALQSTECSMVLAWQNWLSARVIRRLQLAASEGNTLGVLFHHRPTPHSPASVQLEIAAAPFSAEGHRQLAIRLLKARGSHRQGEVLIRLPG